MQSNYFQIEGLSNNDDESGIQHGSHRVALTHKRDFEHHEHPEHHEHHEQAETVQTHVHEFLGSTKLAEEGEDRHNHRFAGVTSQEIPKDNSHVHAILTNTDFLDHHHEIGVITGLAIPVGDGKHVHFAEGVTTLDDGHVHEFEFATLIESPLT